MTAFSDFLLDVMSVLGPLCLVLAAVGSIWLLLDAIFGNWGQR